MEKAKFNSTRLHHALTNIKGDAGDLKGIFHCIIKMCNPLSIECRITLRLFFLSDGEGFLLLYFRECARTDFSLLARYDRHDTCLWD